jgi:hypothetical protein
MNQTKCLKLSCKEHIHSENDRVNKIIERIQQLTKRGVAPEKLETDKLINKLYSCHINKSPIYNKKDCKIKYNIKMPKCKTGSLRDKKTLKCIIKKTMSRCPVGSRIDKKINRCVITEKKRKRCKNGYRYNETKKTCLLK